jgi:hypothetical protein
MTIEIDGKEFEVLRMSEDRRGIHTKAGTFWMSPVCFGHAGKIIRNSLTGYVDQKHLMRGRLITSDTKLPNPVPKSVRKITFFEPDIPDPSPETVKVFYKDNKSAVDKLFAEHKTTCKQSGVKPYTLAEFKIYRTKRAVMRAEHGFDDTYDFLLMMAFDGQGVENSAELLASITHEISYPSGEIVYLDSLSDEPAPLPESLRINEPDNPEIMKSGGRFDLLNGYHYIKDKVGGCEYHVTDGTTAHRALKAFAENTGQDNRLPAAKIQEFIHNGKSLEAKPKRWFESGVKPGKNAPDFMKEVFSVLIRNDDGLWWINLHGE